MSIAIIYGGTRPNGNTELLTQQAVKDVSVESFFLKEHTILPIEDKRHDPEGFDKRNDDYDSIIKRILLHDILIFATPIYWYSMSGTMKNFIDRWSQTIRDPDFPDFKSQMSKKKAFVIAVGGDQPVMKGLPMIQQFQYIFDFMGVQFEGYVLGQGNKPGDILNDQQAMSTAALLSERLKQLDEGAHT